MSNTLVLQHVGKVQGVNAYAPVDAEAVKLINGQQFIVCEIKGNKAKRSALQNRAIHMFCSKLSDAFNNAGFDMPTVINRLFKKPSLRWSPSAVKERLWREVQIQTFNKTSTTQLETNEVSIVYESLNIATTQTMGVGVSFPSYLHQLDDVYEDEAKRHG